jgi:hypothetical protein
MLYLTYPSALPGNPGYLHGLSARVKKTPRFSVDVQTATNGAEARIGYWTEPLWQWEISYAVLRDGFRYGNNFDELRKIVGMFLACNGSLTGFQFKDPDDNNVFRQSFGTTLSGITVYTLSRTYGQNDQALGLIGTEAIGFLDTLAASFNLYIDDSATPVSVSDPTYGYRLSTSTPKLQQLIFNSAPPAGHTLSCDMAYNYYVRFETDSMEFDKFMAQLWELKKVTLASLRAGS